jgi:hypothetical protein
MRICAKLHCDSEPDVTIVVRYETREVVVGDLLPERDPNLLDLCREHAERLTPPLGWVARDERSTVPTA